MVNDSAFRSCHANSSPFTRLSAPLITCRGLSGDNLCNSKLSAGSKPVNKFGLRVPALREAARYARINRLRYIAWRENVFALMKKPIKIPKSSVMPVRKEITKSRSPCHVVPKSHGRNHFVIS